METRVTPVEKCGLRRPRSAASRWSLAELLDGSKDKQKTGRGLIQRRYGITSGDNVYVAVSQELLSCHARVEMTGRVRSITL